MILIDDRRREGFRRRVNDAHERGTPRKVKRSRIILSVQTEYIYSKPMLYTLKEGKYRSR